MTNLLNKFYWNAFVVWHARREARLPFAALDELGEVQNRRVRAIVAHAYSTVPFYREVMDKRGLMPSDFRTAADLEKLPIVTGNELETDPERFLSRPYAGGRSLRIYSSGTSGRPKYINHDPAALFLMMAHGDRQRTVLAHFMGRKFGYREMVASPPGSVSFQLRDFYEARSWVPQGLDFQRGMLPLDEGIEDSLRRVNSFKPDLIRGIGSFIGVIFRQAYERSLPIHRPKAILYGASQIADYDRSIIENEFGIPVISSYQAAEALRIAYQCERKEGFHINLDHTAVRVVDEYGNSVGPGGRGEIVISNLINRATVLLNYKLGDIVTLGEEACPCGRSLPTIRRLEGRSGNILRLAGGRLMHGSVLMEKLQMIPSIVQVQIVQEEINRFLVRAVRKPGADWQTIQEQLGKAAHSILGEDNILDIREVDLIPQGPGGKVQPIISHCLD